MKKEEALKILRDLHDKSLFSIRTALETLIPELAKSEDERIREELLYFIQKEKEYMESQVKPENSPRLRFFIDALAYLEKQKEQKPAEKQDYSGLNDLERVIHRGFLAAGVENVPVSIIKETAQECLDVVTNREAKGLLLNGCISFEEYLKIADVPYADKILQERKARQAEKVKPTEWSEADETNGWTGVDLERYLSCLQRLGTGNPQQPETINSKWFKAHCRPQPKQEWSEEDKRMVTGICANLTKYCTQYCNKQSEPSVTQYDFAGKKRKDIKEQCDWLESLRPQPKQEWSKEDEGHIDAICNALTDNISNIGFYTTEALCSWLKSLPYRFSLSSWGEEIKDGFFGKFNHNSWKPSAEQMRALDDAIHFDFATAKRKTRLKSLYEQLKAL